MIADIAAQLGWTNGTLYEGFDLNENIKVSSSGTPNGNYGLNTGKYYTSGNNWRIYQNENPSVVIEAADGMIIETVKITYNNKNTGTLTLNGDNVASDDVITVDASSVTFSVGNTGTATNGQVRITAIEVTYKSATEAVEQTGTLSFDDKSFRTEHNADIQVWKNDGIILTNNKAGSTTNVGDYANPARFYKGSEVVITVEGGKTITKVVITAAGDAKYKTAVGTSLTAAGYTYTVDGDVYTVDVNADNLTMVAAAQMRMASIEVTYLDAGSSEPEDPPIDYPEVDTTLTIEQAIELASLLRNNKYTPGKYYVAGTITQITNAKTGSMKITDADGNVLTINGTFGSDGVLGYNMLSYQPITGDTVIIYGIIGNSGGKAQIKDGWIVFYSVTENTLTVEKAIELGLSMQHNVYTDSKYYVTGKITEVYNTTYGNMKITDGNGNILTIYGTYSEDGGTRYDALDVKPVVGDTVTVYGIVGQYNNVAQIKNGWITEHIVNPDAPVEPDPEYPEYPEADSTLTIEQATELGLSMNHNVYTPGKYYVTGTIKEVYNTQYGNMRIVDEDGNVLTIYGTYGADGSDRYDALAVKPVAGQVVTIYGIVGQYNNVAQIKNGWIVKIDGEGETPDTPDQPSTELPEADSKLTIEQAIAIGSAMAHNTYTDGKYYVTGTIKEVYNEQYGNMRIVDEDGNVLTIYGTYGADGADRYDALEVKPVAGDVVTIYGILGQYNSVAQIKNGWIISINETETETDETESTEPVETDPVETDPVETDPVETDPVATDPVETDPVETDPVETDPVETDPVETDPVETDPVETDPVETDPVETDPVETDPVETDPVETDPVETDPKSEQTTEKTEQNTEAPKKSGCKSTVTGGAMIISVLCIGLFAIVRKKKED